MTLIEDFNKLWTSLSDFWWFIAFCGNWTSDRL